MPLHPFFQQLQAASAGAPPTHTLPLDVIRQANLAMLPMLGEPEPVARVEDVTIPVKEGTITVRVYTPAGEGPFPVLMTIHGGGWIAGSLAVFDHVSRALVNRVGCIAVSVEHHLAPEHKFPVPLEDCYDALVWTAGHIANYGGDPARIAVLGESAGGNLAAALALLARDRGGPRLAYQVLVNPALGYPAIDRPSIREMASGYGLTREDLIWCYEQYMSSPDDWKNPYFVPMASEDLSGLPPALILTAKYDLLRDDGAVYGDQLRKAGVPAEVVCTEGVMHGFFLLTSLIEPARQAMDTAAAALRKGFGIDR